MIEVNAGAGYVSRAAGKLLGALSDFGLRLSGRALDAGASTGGFSQVLLQQGCSRVYAVDVGHDQLAEEVRTDPRVRVWERTNLRDLDLGHVDHQPVDVVVADVSFISLTLLVKPLLAVLRPDGIALLMVKPQFEVGRERLGKRGVVRSAALHRDAIAQVARTAALLGWRVDGQTRSRLPGPAGNLEYFLLLRHGSEPPPMLSRVTAASQDIDSDRRVAVLTHTGRPEAMAAAARVVAGLARAGICCVLPGVDITEMQVQLAGSDVIPFSNDHHQIVECELAVVLGGDGTILRGAEWVLENEIPLLGVNLGHVGFLAEAESSEIDKIVDHVVQRSYTVEERFTIAVTVRDHDEVVWSSFAVNEVSIEKAARERMLEVLVEVDGRPLSRWGCDGVLVSTPTGSTAYAFSAGGPVIWPGLDALLLLPLSAHALFARPLVLNPTSRVVVELLDSPESNGVVWCDGRRSVLLHGGMEIEVVQGAHRLRLARLSELPFTDRLVRKFGLRVEGWRGATERDG